MEPPEHVYKPANGSIRSIMSEQLLQQQLPESPHFQGLNALPKKFAAIRGSKHEGKIRVNKEASSCWLGLPSSQGFLARTVRAAPLCSSHSSAQMKQPAADDDVGADGAAVCRSLQCSSRCRLSWTQHSDTTWPSSSMERRARGEGRCTGCRLPGPPGPLAVDLRTTGRHSHAQAAHAAACIQQHLIGVRTPLCSCHHLHPIELHL